MVRTMASRTLRVEFVPENRPNEVAASPQVHDVSVPEDVVGAPQFLENPDVDFPGLWALVDDGDALGSRIPADPRDSGSVDRDLVDRDPRDRDLAARGSSGSDASGAAVIDPSGSTVGHDATSGTAVAAGSHAVGGTESGFRNDAGATAGASGSDHDRVYRYARAAAVATTNDTTAVG